MVSHLFLLCSYLVSHQLHFTTLVYQFNRKRQRGSDGGGEAEKKSPSLCGLSTMLAMTSCIICNIMLNVSKCIEKYYFSKQPLE